jgi:hypothetical protein
MVPQLFTGVACHDAQARTAAGTGWQSRSGRLTGLQLVPIINYPEGPDGCLLSQQMLWYLQQERCKALGLMEAVC